ncbi:hypothetical protein CR513_57594, partial [Mucuna pruriens]
MSVEKYNVLFVRHNDKNYSTWAFQFHLFVKGKDLWGHVDGNTPVPNRDQYNVAHSKWEDKDAQVNPFVSLALMSNLIFIGKLVDNDYRVQFSQFDYLVQDQHLGKIIAKGPKARENECW